MVVVVFNLAILSFLAWASDLKHGLCCPPLLSRERGGVNTEEEKGFVAEGVVVDECEVILLLLLIYI